MSLNDFFIYEKEDKKDLILGKHRYIIDDYEHYVYVYLDPRKEGKFKYGEYVFNNEPFYVGKGYDKRLYSHLAESALKRENNTYKINKIRKIKMVTGKNPIIIKVKENLSNEESQKLEKYIIKIIGRHDLKLGPLTNMTDGGEGILGYRHTKITRKKISKAGENRKKFKHSKKTIEKMRIIGKNLWKNTSSEKRKKHGDKIKGYRHTEESKKRIGKAAIGRNVGRSPATKGKPRSEETKRKISEKTTGVLKIKNKSGFCQICNKPFITGSSNKIYCCKNCYKIGKAKLSKLKNYYRKV